MIMSITSNPQPEMDYTSWLTIAGFIMAILLFFMNKIFDKLYDNENENGNSKYHRSLWLFFTFLSIITVAGIFCFILHKMNIGAIIITIALSIIAIYPLYPFWRFLKQRAVKKKVNRIIWVRFQRIDN